MLKLKPDEICPFSDGCPYADKRDRINFCRGTITRECEFTCKLVDENGKVLKEKNRRVSKREP